MCAYNLAEIDGLASLSLCLAHDDAQSQSFHPQPTNSTTDKIICVQTSVRTLSTIAGCLRVCQYTLVRTCDGLSLRLSETGGSFVCGIWRVEAVDDGVNHDCLLRNSKGAVRGDCDPVV
jgi:hypothetical protein